MNAKKILITQRRPRVSCDPSQLRLSPIASLVADDFAVAVAAASLMVAADTSSVFPVRRVRYLPIGFTLVTLFYLLYHEFSRFVVMLHSIVNFQILF